MLEFFQVICPSVVVSLSCRRPVPLAFLRLKSRYVWGRLASAARVMIRSSVAPRPLADVLLRGHLVVVAEQGAHGRWMASAPGVGEVGVYTHTYNSIRTQIHVPLYIYVYIYAYI